MRGVQSTSETCCILCGRAFVLTMAATTSSSSTRSVHTREMLRPLQRRWLGGPDFLYRLDVHGCGRVALRGRVRQAAGRRAPTGGIGASQQRGGRGAGRTPASQRAHGHARQRVLRLGHTGLGHGQRHRGHRSLHVRPSPTAANAHCTRSALPRARALGQADWAARKPLPREHVHSSICSHSREGW